MNPLNETGVTLQFLTSGPDANCALLKAEGIQVLIDAGLPFDALQYALERAGSSLGELDAVFLTHEHQNHTQGLECLCRGTDIQIFMNEGTAQGLLTIEYASWLEKSRTTFFKTGEEFSLSSLSVESFAMPHDGYDPVGFVFKFKSNAQKLVWIGDGGYISEAVKEIVGTADFLMIQPYYDSQLLLDAGLPFGPKQRIRGKHGYLSNQDVHDFLNTLENLRLKRVFFGHINPALNDWARLEQMARALSERLGCPVDVVRCSS